MSTEAFIYDAVRTPRGRGKSNGSLHTIKPIELVTGLIHETLSRNPDLDPIELDDLILGCVTPLGDQGGCMPRTAAVLAGLPYEVPGFQLNRFCSSALESVNTAAQKVRSGWDELIMAGGIESMSRVPMGSDGGPWYLDPETNYDTSFVPQGISADLIATLEGSRARMSTSSRRARSGGRRPRRPRGASRTRSSLSAISTTTLCSTTTSSSVQIPRLRVSAS